MNEVIWWVSWLGMTVWGENKINFPEKVPASYLFLQKKSRHLCNYIKTGVKTE